MLKHLLWLSLIAALVLAAGYLWRDQFPWLQQLHRELGLPETPSGLWNDPRTPAGKITAYRWQDDEGRWHYDTQPPQGIAYEMLSIDPDVNLLPGRNEHAAR